MELNAEYGAYLVEGHFYVAWAYSDHKNYFELIYYCNILNGLNIKLNLLVVK